VKITLAQIRCHGIRYVLVYCSNGMHCRHEARVIAALHDAKQGVALVPKILERKRFYSYGDACLMFK